MSDFNVEIENIGSKLNMVISVNGEKWHEMSGDDLKKADGMAQVGRLVKKAYSLGVTVGEMEEGES